jgi:hypothetical protein
MPKYVGGRGIKAPYQTTHCRIPEPIKPLVEKLSADYKATLDVPKIPLSKIEAEKIVEELLINKRMSKKVALEKLLTAIYG